MEAFNIDLPSGQVTSLGILNLPLDGSANDRSYCESWATWGVAEYAGAAIKLVFVGASQAGEGTIKRYDVSSGTFSTVADFPAGLSDMCSISVDPSVNRWYFHYEGSAGAFNFGGDENIGYADATFLGPSSATATIGGKVRSSRGRALSGVVVKALRSDGNTTTAMTNTFGYYSLPKLRVGETYVVTVESRRYYFPISRQVVTLYNDLKGLDFEAR